MSIFPNNNPKLHFVIIEVFKHLTGKSDGIVIADAFVFLANFSHSENANCNFAQAQQCTNGSVLGCCHLCITREDWCWRWWITCWGWPIANIDGHLKPNGSI